jgi:hypothetical protein
MLVIDARKTQGKKGQLQEPTQKTQQKSKLWHQKHQYHNQT